jgi:hypothetical protein
VKIRWFPSGEKYLFILASEEPTIAAGILTIYDNLVGSVSCNFCPILLYLLFYKISRFSSAFIINSLNFRHYLKTCDPAYQSSFFCFVMINA